MTTDKALARGNCCATCPFSSSAVQQKLNARHRRIFLIYHMTKCKKGRDTGSF
jgi:hypothetical protein